MKPTNKATLFSSAKELAVSEILLDLGNIISLSESNREKFTWGVKRKRSTPTIPFPRANPQPAVNELTRVKLAENNLASPNTTLTFLPSESDENNNNNAFMESLKKMTKEDCMKMEEQLIKSRECLARDVENMKRYRSELKEENWRLKVKKQEVLKTFQGEENPEMEENTAVNYFGNNMVPPYHNLQVQDHNIEHRFQDFNGHGPVVNQVGPRGIPDLNMTAEEAVALPMDMNAVNAEKRARFAEARRLRRGKIKIKAMRSACGITLPTLN